MLGEEYQSEPLDFSIGSTQNQTTHHEEEQNQSENDVKVVDCHNGAVGPLLSGAYFMSFYCIEAKLCDDLHKQTFNSVKYIYNPVEYALEPHLNFLKKYCNGTKTLLFLGMNPGPYGMCQTGVPFGDVTFVKDWLKVSGTVKSPPIEHPKKKILGFNSKRKEVSGFRFWNLIQELCGSPQIFFQHCFVHNYCPLAFLSETGKNITPPDLSPLERQNLMQTCDDALRQVLELLQTKVIVAIGRYAFQRIKAALPNDTSIRVEKIMHPSPINPAANKGFDIRINCFHNTYADLKL